MESPIKKINLGKENTTFDADVDTIANKIESHKPTEKEQEKKELAVAPTIKSEEADEPILQENPQRFVLFPIKYHEVSDASRRVK